MERELSSVLNSVFAIPELLSDDPVPEEIFGKAAVSVPTDEWDLQIAVAEPVEKSAPMGKSELTSRMYNVLSAVAANCIGDEYSLIEKAIRALDVSAFAELSERDIQRMKHAPVR